MRRSPRSSFSTWWSPNPPESAGGGFCFTTPGGKKKPRRTTAGETPPPPPRPTPFWGRAGRPSPGRARGEAGAVWGGGGRAAGLAGGGGKGKIGGGAGTPAAARACAPRAWQALLGGAVRAGDQAGAERIPDPAAAARARRGRPVPFARRQCAALFLFARRHRKARRRAAEKSGIRGGAEG